MKTRDKTIRDIDVALDKWHSRLTRAVNAINELRAARKRREAGIGTKRNPDPRNGTYVPVKSKRGTGSFVASSPLPPNGDDIEEI